MRYSKTIVNDELAGMWEEMIVTHFNILPMCLHGEDEEN